MRCKLSTRSQYSILTQNVHGRRTMSSGEEPTLEFEAWTAKVKVLMERYKGEGPTISGRLLFRPRPSPPPRVYKYTSSQISYLILSGMSLRYTQAEVLDDLFEEAPPRDEIRRLMPHFEDGPTMVIDVTDPDERLQMFDRVLEARSLLRQRDEPISDDVPIITSNGLIKGWKYDLGNRPFKEFLEESRKPLALSLTTLPVDRKMWSLYGDQHRGICLGFDTRSRYFRSNRDIIDRSGYFAPIVYRRLSIEDYAYRYPHERFFIKDPEWSDQREWRRLELAINKPDTDWKSKVLTFAFPPEALASISFGARCPEDDRKHIIELIRSRDDLKHVRFSSIKMSVGEIIQEDSVS